MSVSTASAVSRPREPVPTDEVVARLVGLNEVRRVLEAGTAALAAKRGTPEQMAAISDEVTEMYAALFFERCRATIERAHNLKESADMHRRIYQAIHARDHEAAREAMDEHVLLAQMAQAEDDAVMPQPPARPAQPAQGAGG